MPVDYYSTKEAVQDAALHLRERHNALDWSAKIDHLIECEGLAQDRFEPWSLGRMYAWLSNAIEKTAKKVQALLSVKEDVILISHDLPDSKTPFAKGHELGHSTLPWHRDVLYVCDEHDLSQATRDQMEFEANLFSSEVLLPAPLLDKVYGNYETSMNTVLLLREWSGASFETCAIKYVERHPGKCALLVLDDAKDKNGNPGLRLTRKKLSQRGVAVFHRLGKDQFFGADHTLYGSSRITGVSTTEIVFTGERFKVSLLNNTYRVMALLYRD